MTVTEVQLDAEHTRTRYRSAMSLDRLFPSPDNARRHYDDASLRDLAASIKADGITNPLTVIAREEPDPNTGKMTFYVIAGERRRRAAALAGLEHVPVIYLKDPNLVENATRIAIAENTLRVPLNPYEETMAILDYTAYHLGKTEKWDDFRAQHASDRHAAGHAIKLFAKGGTRHAELEATTGITAETLEQHLKGLLGERDGMRPSSFVSNRLKLLDLPEDVQRACQAGELDYTKANLVASVKDEQQQQAILERAVKEALSHKALSHIVKETEGDHGPAPEVIARLTRVKRDLRTAWAALPDKDRTRVERLLRDLEKVTSLSRARGQADGSPGAPAAR